MSIPVVPTITMGTFSTRVAELYSSRQEDISSIILGCAMQIAEVICDNLLAIGHDVKPIIDMTPDDAFLDDENAKKNFMSSDRGLLLIKLLPFTIDWNEEQNAYIRTDTLALDLLYKHFNVSSDYHESSLYKFKDMEGKILDGFDLSGNKWYYNGNAVCQERFPLHGDVEDEVYTLYANMMCHISRLRSSFINTFWKNKVGVEIYAP